MQTALIAAVLAVALTFLITQYQRQAELKRDDARLRNERAREEARIHDELGRDAAKQADERLVNLLADIVNRKYGPTLDVLVARRNDAELTRVGARLLDGEDGERARDQIRSLVWVLDDLVSDAQHSAVCTQADWYLRRAIYEAQRTLDPFLRLSPRDPHAAASSHQPSFPTSDELHHLVMFDDDGQYSFERLRSWCDWADGVRSESPLTTDVVAS
jgi:hypothetical protein